jgi:hypothetical protein
VTGFSPMQLHLVKLNNPLQAMIEFPLPTDVGLEIVLERARNKLEKGVKRKLKYQAPPNSLSEFNPGDLVLLRSDHQSSASDKENKKFFFLFEGPFEVQKKLHCYTYLLRIIDSNKEIGIFIRRLLKKCYS